MIDPRSGVEIGDDTPVGQVVAWIEVHGAESAGRNFHLTDLQIRRLKEVYLDQPGSEDDDLEGVYGADS